MQRKILILDNNPEDRATYRQFLQRAPDTIIPSGTKRRENQVSQWPNQYSRIVCSLAKRC